MRLRLCTLMTALMLAACSPAATATPTPTPQEQAVVASPRLPATPVARPVAEWTDRIAYRGDDDGLWLMKPDGSDRQLVHLPPDTGSPAYDTRFVWSPDGSRIAFVNGSDLLVAGLPTGITHLVYRSHTAPGSGPESILPAPVWNSDGMAVAFIDGRTLRIAELDTGQVSVVADDVWSEAWANDPGGSVAWSADGRFILYLVGEGQSDELRGLAAVSPDEPGQSRLIVPNAIAFTLSPGGRYVVYRLGEGGLWREEIRCLVSRRAVDCPSVATRLVPPADDPGFSRLRWSPNGTHVLAFSLPGNVWVIASSGETRKIDPGGPALHETNPWSPGGRQLVLPLVYDGGMTNSPLVIHDLITQKTIQLPGFEAFSKGREAAWGPSSPPPTAVQPDARIEPLVSAPAIRFDGWSPDGNWLAYWMSSDEDVAGGFYPFPPGRLQFFNVRTGRSCLHPEFIARDYGDRLLWQPDGRVVVFSDDMVRQGTPCLDDFLPASIRHPDTSQGEPNSALSPGETYQASTVVHDEVSGPLSVTTTFVETATGRAKETIEWKHRGGLGELGLGGQWLTDDQFLIYETLDRGPLLITVGKEIIKVAPQLFGAPLGPATAAVVSGTHTYHIVLSGDGVTADFPPVRFYHSETGEVEDLPFQHLWWQPFSPDGRWLFLDAQPIKNDQHHINEIWLRPVDPAGSEARLLASDVSSSIIWSPDGTSFALSSQKGIFVLSFPDGTLLGSWDTGGYSVYLAAWSPDGEFLVAEGNIPGKWPYALFLIRVSPQGQR